MEILLAPLIGLLVATGAYLMMSGKTLPYVFGLTLLSHSANLLIFAVGRLTYARPPLIPEAEATITGAANALPQALILTAIVISFGLTVFVLCLACRSYGTLRTTDMDETRGTEPLPGGPV